MSQVTEKEMHAKKMNGSEARHLLQLPRVMKAFMFIDGIFLNESSVDIVLQALYTDRPITSH